MRRVVTLLIGCSASGCLLLVGTDGLVGGAGSPSDAGLAINAGDAGTDTAPPVDAALDSSADTATDASFCTTANATFCSDFEQGALPSPWESSVGFGKATLSIEASEAKTGQRALVASCPTLSGGEQTVALLRKPLGQVIGGAISIDFSIRPEAIGQLPGGGWAVAKLESADSSGNKCVLFFRVSSTVTELVESCALADGGNDFAKITAPPLPTNAWAAVHVEAQLTQTSTKYSFDLGGKRIGEVAGNLHNYRLSPTFFVGHVFLAAPTAPWRIRFDDVSVTASL
jgi:hypothetical protein